MPCSNGPCAQCTSTVSPDDPASANAYRLAWHQLSGAPLDGVRAAFVYVRSDETVRPTDLLDAEGLRAMVHGVPVTLGPA